MYIVFAGVGPLLVVPFANVYGRRPVYLLGNVIAAITNIIAGHCHTWAGVMITRGFNGVAGGSTVAIGAATICDLYFQHERGLYMGIYTFFLTNGPHVRSLFLPCLCDTSLTVSNPGCSSSGRVYCAKHWLAGLFLHPGIHPARNLRLDCFPAS